jgi:plasmid stability protein
MNEITIRNLDNADVQRLRLLAWQDGRPLEEIVRSLLIEAAKARDPKRSGAFSSAENATSRHVTFPSPTD